MTAVDDILLVEVFLRVSLAHSVCCTNLWSAFFRCLDGHVICNILKTFNHHKHSLFNSRLFARATRWSKWNHFYAFHARKLLTQFSHFGNVLGWLCFHPDFLWTHRSRRASHWHSHTHANMEEEIIWMSKMKIYGVDFTYMALQKSDARAVGYTLFPGIIFHSQRVIVPPSFSTWFMNPKSFRWIIDNFPLHYIIRFQHSKRWVGCELSLSHKWWIHKNLPHDIWCHFSLFTATWDRK